MVDSTDSQRLGEIPPHLPILPIKDLVMFPFTIVPIVITDKQTLSLVSEVSVGDRLLGVFSMRETIKAGSVDNLYSTGTLGYIHRVIKGKEGVQVIMQGQTRIKLGNVIATEPYLQAQVYRHPDKAPQKDDVEAEALIKNLADLFSRFIALSARLPEDLIRQISRLNDPRHLVYVVADNLSLEVGVAQELLELDDIKQKLIRVTELVGHEIDVLELSQKIGDEARSEMEKTQREYILRQQLRAIQKELGEGDEEKKVVEEIRDKITKAKMPEEAEKEARRELSRLESLPTTAPEYPIIESYLDWLVSLPWSNSSTDSLDITRGRQILDEDHYDLKEVKERILEYLSVRKLRLERGEERAEDVKVVTLRPERRGAILCFVGPPGVGKTSLGLSIARALGRKFTRMSLGGMRDEAEIRGHRRTYVGAVPGRIIQSLRRAGTKNPVFMLDEIDKVGADWRGDPSSALLEVLDPEQNREFRDNYLNVPFDLSQVLFIATANILDTIPDALRDRMEIMQLSGYTDLEKLHIAEQYIVPRQLKENSLRKEEIVFEPEAILLVIRDYTREAGVRDLERQIGSICRKQAVLVVEHAQMTVTITPEIVRQLLGKEKFYHEARERTDIPGVAIGVAVTASGGDIIFIEATKMPGHRNFSLTGQLGGVMKESAQAAFSLIRSKAKQLHIDPHEFEGSDVHVHVPAGAVPKDGPSAGVTIATALASLFTSRPVKADVGMTGEITLRGKILPVGGVKEKALAGHRIGLRTIIIPKHNEKDLDELPASVKQDLRFILVENIDEVLEVALESRGIKSSPAFDFERIAGSADHAHH